MCENTQLNMKYYENKVNTFIKITSIIIKKHNMIKIGYLIKYIDCLNLKNTLQSSLKPQQLLGPKFVLETRLQTP